MFYCIHHGISYTNTPNTTTYIDQSNMSLSLSDSNFDDDPHRHGHHSQCIFVPTLSALANMRLQKQSQNQQTVSSPLPSLSQPQHICIPLQDEMTNQDGDDNNLNHEDAIMNHQQIDVSNGASTSETNNDSTAYSDDAITVITINSQ